MWVSPACMCAIIVIMTSLLGSVTGSPQVDGQDVTITYTNGDKCGQSGKLYRSKITFICKKGLTVGFNVTI